VGVSSHLQKADSYATNLVANTTISLGTKKTQMGWLLNRGIEKHLPALTALSPYIESWN